MALRRPGAAAIGLVKAIALVGVALAIWVPVVNHAFAQVEPASGGGEVLWLALAVIVPMILVFVGWMIRDSGNLRQLTGEYRTTQKQVEKVDDSQERIFRELGGAEAYRDALTQRLERMDADIKLGDKFRHDLRNELTGKIVDLQVSESEKDDKLEARILDLERRGRGNR